jgi:phosphotransferase system enzyme I (PtsP)
MLETLRRIVQVVSTATDLDQAARIIVRRLKEAMVVQGCSVFLTDQQSNEHLLIASEGLSPDAVGQVRIAPGDGLVGYVAEHSEPLNLADAPDDPRFLPIPEIGEEAFRAFLGVPVIHQGRLMGVLVVQRKEAIPFTEDESSFLVTIAAQLAGVINHAALDGSVGRLLEDSTQDVRFLRGIPGSSGVAVGTVAVVFPEETLESIPDRTATDRESEADAFRAAVAGVQEDLREGSAQLTDKLAAEERALFDAYVMLAGSDSVVTDTLTRIEAGSWAPGALRETIAEHALVFEQMDDPYLRARAEDIRAVGRQILRRLQSGNREARRYPRSCILVGEEISVADITEVPAGCLAGIVCTRGSALSHTAILARGLGVPAVLGLGELSLGPLDGRDAAVDGYLGRVFIQPSVSVLDEYRRLAAEETALNKGLEGIRDLPAETPDGARLALYMNGGLLADLPSAIESGAEGVGLYRTEFAFMARDSFPGEDDQYRVYRKALILLAPKPVTMRTLDVGGDKPLPYFRIEEENPYLGWRGIRVTLDHPEIMLSQLRAMLRANAGLNNLRILLPMVSKVSEVDAAIELIDQAYRDLQARGLRATKPPLGVMVETPASLYQIPVLARRVDFFSVGTNDLTQYLLVVDRNNALVAGLFDSLHPAILRAINQVVDESHRWGKPVGVCGEMAGEPMAALLLSAMGVESLSMSGPDLLRVKRVIRTFERNHAAKLLARALEMEGGREVRGLMIDAFDQAGMGGLVRAGL